MFDVHRDQDSPPVLVPVAAGISDLVTANGRLIVIQWQLPKQGIAVTVSKDVKFQRKMGFFLGKMESRGLFCPI